MTAPTSRAQMGRFRWRGQWLGQWRGQWALLPQKKRGAVVTLLAVVLFFVALTTAGSVLFVVGFGADSPLRTAFSSREESPHQRLRREDLATLERSPLFRISRPAPPPTFVAKTPAPAPTGPEALEGYGLSGVVRVGDRHKAFLTLPSGEATYVGEGEVLGNYVVLRIQSGRVLMGEAAGARGRSPAQIMADPSSRLYFIGNVGP